MFHHGGARKSGSTDETSMLWQQVFSHHALRKSLTRTLFAHNRIKHVREPFYQDFYFGLAKINKKWADEVTASVIYY
jgi:hypothetical protein